MDIQTFFIAFLAFIAVVVGLIVLHEFGHYLAGRMFGLIPKAFSVGMGPEIARYIDKHGTRWKLCVLPLGGYVKFAGEIHPGSGSDEDRQEDHNFAGLARWKRAIIIAAGPVTNILVTAFIFLGLTLVLGKPTIEPVVQQVELGSSAEEAGLQVGDRITAVDGEGEFDLQQTIRKIRIYPGKQVVFDVERKGEEMTIPVPIREKILEADDGAQYKIGSIGVIFPRALVRTYSLSDLLDGSFLEAIRLFKFQAVAMGQMVSGERSLDEISGPLRLAKMSGEQATLGVVALLAFSAFISIAIAFMNLLPIPGLDGGYLALYLIESILQRDVSLAVLTFATRCGYAVVGVLMIFAFSNDLRMLLG